MSAYFRNMADIMADIILKKTGDLYCEKCGFNTVQKSDYNRHILTAKHKRLTCTDTKNIKKTESINVWKCECGKSYMQRQSLFKHKKKCKYIEGEEKETTPEKKEDIDYKELLIQAMKQMSEQQKVMSEQQKQITEMIPLIGNNNNNTNNKFNLNFFLNETCKDALNINDFIDSLQLQLNDLDKMNELGYVNGLTRIFLNGLNQLDLTKRPLHCSDAKREILYVKENDEWDKEESKTKLNHAISTVGRKTFKHFPEWMETHPNCNDSNSQDNEEYHSLIKNTITQNTEDNKNKVAKNIIKDVVIDK